MIWTANNTTTPEQFQNPIGKAYKQRRNAWYRHSNYQFRKLDDRCIHRNPIYDWSRAFYARENRVIAIWNIRSYSCVCPSCLVMSIHILHSVVSYIFVGVNFRASAEAKMIVDIFIRCFDTCKCLFLLFMPFVVNWISWFVLTKETHENWYLPNKKNFQVSYLLFCFICIPCLFCGDFIILFPF
jgi:hypothetical protein